MAEAPENQKEEKPSENIRQEKSQDESTESTLESNEISSSPEAENDAPVEDQSNTPTSEAASNPATEEETPISTQDDLSEKKTQSTEPDQTTIVDSGEKFDTEPTSTDTSNEDASSTEVPGVDTHVEDTSVPDVATPKTDVSVTGQEEESVSQIGGESAMPVDKLAEETKEGGESSSEADETSGEAAKATPEEKTKSTPTEESGESETDEEDEDHQEAPDYSQLTREELFQEIEKLAKAEEVKSTYPQARQLKAHFDELEAGERENALQQFVREGGEEDGFEYRKDTLHEQFYAAFHKIREQRTQKRASREKERQQNLETKQDILNQLREFVDSEETQVSINKLKELQKDWREVGEVPSQHNRSLWANYNALLDRFYDNRSIYFELKELDRKKNLEAKSAIADRAEQLVEEPDLKKATDELDELHEEYKHIGPVPRDEQEALWQRFKASSDKVHDRRRENVEAFKEQLKENLIEKEKLAEEVLEFANFESDSIKEWNKKTKDLQQLQKRWDAIGSMPRTHAKEVNRKFWSHFKDFFAHKGEFFKRLDAMREENLQKKEALVARAEGLKDNDDWKNTSNELKALQREWKEVGPVPEKSRESIYQRFKAACDHFFNRRRANSQETEVEYQNNLKIKEDICTQIEQLAEAKSSDLNALNELTEQYREIGFVPRGAMKSISERYQAAVDKFLKNAKALDDTQKQEVQVNIELGNIKNSPGAYRKINQKEGNLRRQISRLEDDISLWKNNITFFASSKQADKLIAEVEQKIEKAGAELEQLKSQLDVLQNLRED